MKYCDKFYEVAKPLYDAITAAFSEAYLYDPRSSEYGTIPRVVYMTENAYTDKVLDEWGKVCEYFQVYDFEEPCPIILCSTVADLPNGVEKWEY